MHRARPRWVHADGYCGGDQKKKKGRRCSVRHRTYKWLAFTAITLGILDSLNEQQQREHEAAQIAATTAPIGERIIWKESNAAGYVVATREGTSVSGRYCREFQHQVSIGGRTEQAYGTACRNPDGSWQVVSDSGY